MDELKRLEREVRDLQNKLRQQNEQAERARQRMIDENRRNLEKYQSEMQRALREHDAAAKAEYERLLREYQYSVGSEAGRKLAETDRDYQNLINEVRRNEEALAKKNRELDRVVQELKSSVTHREEGSMEQAQEYLYSAAGEYREIEAKPHEKFMPKRLAIFYNSIKDGQKLFKAGLFEAATAVAISVRSGLERLGYNIDDKATEWESQFDLLTLKENYLRQSAAQELADWKEFIGHSDESQEEDDDRRIAEINFWSRGEYADIIHFCDNISEMIFVVQKEGKESYLRRADGVSTDDLKQFIQDIDGLSERLSAMGGIYKERYSASCERADWGEKIIDFLTGEINLRWVGELSGFREADGETLHAKDFQEFIQAQFGDGSVREDLRQWHSLVFENASGTTIYVYILPMESGKIVKNKIILHIDYAGADQIQYSRDIYAHICEAIGLGEEAEDTVNYTPDVNVLKASANSVYKETAADLEKEKKRR